MRASFTAMAIAVLVVPTVVLAVATSDGPGSDSIGHGKDACGGVAPGVTECATATHTNLLGDVPYQVGIDPATLHHGVTPMWNSGCSCTVESRFVWLPFGLADALTSLTGQVRGQRIYTCNLQRGFIYDCAGVGEFPPFGPYLLTHGCKAFAYRTTMPGGVGPWECYVAHDENLPRNPLPLP
ncbi:MAG: hypothetical protein LC624_03695 [Halobacteriales archaeon]|nr:hypothetical protein [Halobacteriales archaeon]